MQEPTDDQLDGLFRKSAEEFNAPFDPVAWQALKNQLDTRDRLTIWEHLFRWGLPVLLLLFLVGGSWNAYRQRATAGQIPGTGVAVWQPAPANVEPMPGAPTNRRQQRANNEQLPPKETASGLTKSDDPAETVAQPGDGKRPGLTAKTDETARKLDEDVDKTVVSSPTGERSDPITVGGTNGKIRPDKATPPARPAYRIKPVRPSLATAPALTVRRPERARSATGQQRRSRRLSGGIAKTGVATIPRTDYATKRTGSFSKRPVRPDVTAERLAKESAFDRFDKSFLSESDGAEFAELLLFNELTNRPGQWPKPLPFTGREVTAPINTAETKQPSSVQPLQKGLSVRFVVSPDLSGIGLRNVQRPGTNVGLLLEYRLASRWSVQAGVMRSTKVYKALPSDYEWPAGWKWKLLPESISGHCNVIDIPINIRYDVALRPRSNGQAPSRWFVSGGATTYIMQQEKYVYNYPIDAHVYPSTPREWNEKTGWYNFSQLNLSAGYERALSRRLSWQVEPFAKVPLKGVGFFKIDLLSTGAFFSLRYKL